MQNSVPQGNNIPTSQIVQQPTVQAVPTSTQQVQNPQISQPQVTMSPTPNYSGVNIQIFNPTVATPGSSTACNVNSPSYGTNPCYPSNYYTQPMAQNVNPSPVAIDEYGKQNSTNNNVTTEKVTKETKETTETTKKTEKRQVVQLTDDYIRNVENYLNSQDKEIRMMGAKEVVARLEEDDSRKDDKALTALINKMLQDPDSKIRILALGMLDARKVTGDDYTVNVLKNMQNSQDAYGMDALQASNILLKMSGKTVEKEFEVTSKKSNKE